MPNINMSEEQFATMITTIVQEARKPSHDPIKEQQKARAKDRLSASIRDKRQMDLNKFLNCSHMQRGGVLTGCSAIAWATQSDGKRRGPCQHCGTLFSPVRDECIDDAVWAAYNHMIRIPTHPGGDVAYTFQNA